MLRSMYSGVTGLKAHQTWIDTIGNNIANVNTTAYKGDSMSFDSLLSQNIKNSEQSTPNKSSVNPMQVGLGSKVASTKISIQKQGSMQKTNYALDFMIDGESFFVVHGNGSEHYTKDGNFTLDSNGDLTMRSNGFYVYGWTSLNGRTVDTTGEIGKINFFGATNPDLPDDNKLTIPTRNIVFEGNLDDNDADLSSAKGEARTVSVADEQGNRYNLSMSFHDNGDGSYTLRFDSMSGTNGTYDVSGLAPITVSYNYATGAFESVNGVPIGWTEVNLPVIGNVVFNFASTTAVSTLADNVYISGSMPDWVTFENMKTEEDGKTYLGDENRIPIRNVDGTVTNYTATKLDFSNGFNKKDLIDAGFYTTCCTCYAHYSIRFNEGEGNTAETSGAHLIYNIDISDANSAAEVVSAIVNGLNEIEGAEGDRATPHNHFTTMIQDPNNAGALIVYDNREGMVSGDGFGRIGKGVATERKSEPTLSTLKADADGGNMIGYDVDQSGYIFARYDGTGQEPRLIGQIAVANFDNVTGLQKAGQNLFDTTPNSGEIHIHEVGESGERILSGVLEASNVDLAKEFSEMILSQRGFQVNSRVISTSDQMLQTAENLKQ